MKEHNYISIGEHTETIGKTTFLVCSFADEDADRTAEQLLIELLKSKAKDITDIKEDAA